MCNSYISRYMCTNVHYICRFVSFAVTMEKVRASTLLTISKILMGRWPVQSYVLTHAHCVEPMVIALTQSNIVLRILRVWRMVVWKEPLSLSQGPRNKGTCNLLELKFWHLATPMHLLLSCILVWINKNWITKFTTQFRNVFMLKCQCL